MPEWMINDLKTLGISAAITWGLIQAAKPALKLRGVGGEKNRLIIRLFSVLFGLLSGRSYTLRLCKARSARARLSAQGSGPLRVGSTRRSWARLRRGSRSRGSCENPDPNNPGP